MRTLVLGPKIVCTNWGREVVKYSKITSRDVIVLKGTGAQKAEQLRRNAFDSSHQGVGKIVVTNYETLQNEEVFKVLLAWNPEIIIGDEAHRLKNPESVRAKKTIALADRAKHRVALTGTPILNSAMDIFNIFRFLDSGKSFGVNFWKFRHTWFEDENARWSGKPGYFPKYVPRPEAYAEFSKIIYKKSLRALKSECLDLPPFVRKEVHVELSPEQRRMYEQMKKTYIAFVEDLEKSGQPLAVVAQLAITKALRLQQIITGFAKTEEGTIHRIEKNPRLEALEELLEEHSANHKIIVWSVFRENYVDIARVCEKLKIGYRELHGAVKGADRDANIEAFCKDPSVRVLIANQGAGGIGINLVESDISIFYSKNFSLEQDIQAEGRNYRGGSEQHTSVTRIDIVATDTIDALISEALANKQKIGERILEWKGNL
jgi:SNF2 family DNA or RNA helicase